MKVVLHLLLMENYVVGVFFRVLFGGQLLPGLQNAVYRLRILCPLIFMATSLNPMVIAYVV